MATTLDFVVIDTSNCKTLGIVDLSSYDSPGTVSSAKLVIGVPGFAAPVNFPFVIQKVNVLNSNNLGITTGDAGALANLPDGFYKVTLSISPNSTSFITKTFMRVCKLQCHLDKSLLKLNILDNSDTEKRYKLAKFREIEFMIASCIAAGNICNQDLAIRLYRRAEKELNKLDLILDKT